MALAVNHTVSKELPGTSARSFIWAGGIEDTFVPQTRPGHRALDEYQLMGHYEHWREDIALAREAGLSALRWGVPWYRVEPFPGEFDWRWTDQVIPYMVQELGLLPIIDLMHYGCPFWLYREFANDDYPQLVARYAAAFAERYKGLVSWYTPLNEALINSVYCGLRGYWPPYLRGERGYVRIMLQLVRGIQYTVQALKEIDPDSVMVHVDVAGASRTVSEDLEDMRVRDELRRYLSYDLLTGMVTPGHPFYLWLLESGATEMAVEAISDRAIKLDVIGLNFYPQWSTQQLFRDRRGRILRRSVEKTGEGFAAMIQGYYDRYLVPLMVTETSARGTDKARSHWLTTSISAVKGLRAEGVPVLGYTWFPIFTMIHWSYRTGTGPLDQYRLELGLYTLGEPDGPRWIPTPLASELRDHIANPEEAVGSLVQRTRA